jgi:hypothetical protein
MSKFLVRFNKTRGMPGRGSIEHVWRVFEGDKEYLVKHVKINTPAWDEQTGEDWSIACIGELVIDRETSTAIINSEQV